MIVEQLDSSLGNQAAILRDRGQRARALALHQKEKTLCQRLYNREGLQKCLGNQARLLQDQEDYDAALDLLKERETICRQDGYREDLARTLFQQASLFGLRLGAAEHARPLAEEALRWAKGAEDAAAAKAVRKNLAKSWMLTGQALAALQRPCEAAEYLRRSVAVADELGHGSLRWQARLGLARVSVLIHRMTEAAAAVG